MGVFSVFGAGAVVGVVGGLIGLGGAEFRLPLLIGPFHFSPLRAVIINKAISLVVVASSLLFRARTIPLYSLFDQWPIILNLLAGSLVGAWAGAALATRLTSCTLCRVIAVLLLVMAMLLLIGHDPGGDGQPLLVGGAQVGAGVVAGFAIGVVASLLGVAGGELLIPTLILLFGIDIKLAGSLSLAISLPTMMVGFARYSQDQSFTVIKTNRKFVATMALGSIAGAFVGGQLLGIAPASLLLPCLALILTWSAVKVWRHNYRDTV